MRCNNEYRKYWDGVIMVFAVYSSVWTPLTISFSWAIDQDSNSVLLQVINTMITVFYTVDIFAKFFTSYYNVLTGDEIFHPRYIASYYMKRGFLIDFLSTFPFRLMISSTNVSEEDDL